LGLLLNPGTRGCQLLTAAGVNSDEWIAALRAHTSIRQDASPSAAMGVMLTDALWLLDPMFRVLLTFAGGRYGGLIVSSVVADGMRLAARLGHPRASSAHVLCALLETDKQIHRADGASQRPDIVRRRSSWPRVEYQGGAQRRLWHRPARL
jgi:hypothetical protein